MLSRCCATRCFPGSSQTGILRITSYNVCYTKLLRDCELAGGVPFAPKAALLGTVDLSGPEPRGIPLRWTDMTGVSTDATITMADGVTTRQIKVTENPTVGDIEEWQIYNFTEDAHPIHLHLVHFEVVSRTLMDGTTPSPHGSVQPWEAGS